MKAVRTFNQPEKKFKTIEEAKAHLKSLGCQYIIETTGVIPKSMDEPRSKLARAYKAMLDRGCEFVTYAAGPMLSKYPSAGFKLVVGGK